MVSKYFFSRDGGGVFLKSKNSQGLNIIKINQECYVFTQHVVYVVAARIVTQSRKHEHITPILKSLHWLPVHSRIQCKLLLLTFKSLNGLAPPYLSDLLTPYTPAGDCDLPATVYSLFQGREYASVGDRAFVKAAPVLWNALPLQLRLCSSLSSFKRNLKTHLFASAYD